MRGKINGVKNYLQLEKVRGRFVLIQPMPVVVAIKLTIKNERKTIISPKTEKTTVFLAPSSFLASPPEMISLIPPIIIKITAIVPTSKISQ